MSPDEPLTVIAKFPPSFPAQSLKDHAIVQGPATVNCAVCPEVPIWAEVNVADVPDESAVVVVVDGEVVVVVSGVTSQQGIAPSAVSGSEAEVMLPSLS
jgi:hypothetical protein